MIWLGRYRVGSWAQAKILAPTLSLRTRPVGNGWLFRFSQLQLQCRTSISVPQSSSPRIVCSELSAKRAAKNVVDCCRADQNTSSKSLASYFKSKKCQSKVARRSLKTEKKSPAWLPYRVRSRSPPSINRRYRSPQVSFQICPVWFLKFVGSKGPRLVSTTLTRFWRKLASYQPEKNFDDLTAVFLATPESFKVVRCGLSALPGQNVRKTRVIP